METNDKPLYHTVAQAIGEQIETGVYAPGSRLPGERHLAEDGGGDEAGCFDGGCRHCRIVSRSSAAPTVRTCNARNSSKRPGSLWAVAPPRRGMTSPASMASHPRMRSSTLRRRQSSTGPPAMFHRGEDDSRARFRVRAGFVV